MTTSAFSGWRASKLQCQTSEDASTWASLKRAPVSNEWTRPRGCEEFSANKYETAPAAPKSVRPPPRAS
eukprot:7372965-Prymnesium_polylepis.1